MNYISSLKKFLYDCQMNDFILVRKHLAEYNLINNYTLHILTLFYNAEKLRKRKLISITSV